MLEISIGKLIQQKVATNGSLMDKTDICNIESILVFWVLKYAAKNANFDRGWFQLT